MGSAQSEQTETPISFREWELSASRRSVIFTKFHFHGDSERSNVADERLNVFAFAADFALQGLEERKSRFAAKAREEFLALLREFARRRERGPLPPESGLVKG